MSKEPNLAAFNEWICIDTILDRSGRVTYLEGQCYLFHEDSPQNSDFFKLVVDENDEPIKKLVRWD